MKITFLQAYFIKYWREIFIALLSIGFFVATASFNFLVQKGGFIKWLSPDETANYFFADYYDQTGDFSYSYYDNVNDANIVMPRSMRSDDSIVKPVSFLGMPILYGQLARIFGADFLPYFTPFIAAVAIFAYFILIKRVFNPDIALIATVFTAFWPPFFYYTARSMFHNVLFVALLVFGLLALSESILSKKTSRGLNFIMLSGVFIGYAIAVRTSEIVWLAPSLLILAVYNWKKISLVHTLLFLAGCFLVFIPVFYYNQILYNSPIYGGYNEMNRSIDILAGSGSSLASQFYLNGDWRAGLEKIAEQIFYFGFHAKESWRNFYAYFLEMFYWLAMPAIFGLGFVLSKWGSLKKSVKNHIVFHFISSIILIFYYGSWFFNDNPDQSSINIGNSYARYWLPIYLCAMPFAAQFIITLSESILDSKTKFIGFNSSVLNTTSSFSASLSSIEKHDRSFLSSLREAVKKLIVLPSLGIFRKYLIIVLVALISFVSLNFTLNSSSGIIHAYNSLTSSQQEFYKVLSLTESHSVIITRYHDKLFFPERRVIVGLFDDENMVREYAKIASKVPVYYYNFRLPKASVDYLNNGVLRKHGLKLKLIENVGEFGLYRLSAR